MTDGEIFLALGAFILVLSILYAVLTGIQRFFWGDDPWL